MKKLEKAIEIIEADISKIKENHLHHIEQDMATLKTNVEWLMRYHWIIATSSIGGLVAALINLLK